jgi:hypothetical protein
MDPRYGLRGRGHVYTVLFYQKWQHVIAVPEAVEGHALFGTLTTGRQAWLLYTYQCIHKTSAQDILAYPVSSSIDCFRLT